MVLRRVTRREMPRIEVGCYVATCMSECLYTITASIDVLPHSLCTASLNNMPLILPQGSHL
jgi:hypothetical protein